MTHPSEIHLHQQTIKLFENGKSISEVGRLLGRSGTWFYKWFNNFRAEGRPGHKNRIKQPHPHNKTLVRVEEVVLNVIDQFPSYAPQRIAYILKRNGTGVGRTVTQQKHDIALFMNDYTSIARIRAIG